MPRGKLPVRKVREVWIRSSMEQGPPVSPRFETNLVDLRGAVLDALEQWEPHYLDWLGSQSFASGPPLRR